MSGRGDGKPADSPVEVSEETEAIRLHARRQAIAYYRAQGLTVIEAAESEPFDLLCRRDDKDVYVQVEATRSSSGTVELSDDEVRLDMPESAERHLFVLEEVDVCEGDPPKALHGAVRVYSGWNPDPEDLRPIRFECSVPDRPDHYGGHPPQYFPWPDVESAREDESLQRQHDEARGRARHEDQATNCPVCGRDPDDLEWFYFESPSRTWRNLAGRAGWMTVCDECGVQVNFFLEVMS